MATKKLFWYGKKNIKKSDKTCETAATDWCYRCNPFNIPLVALLGNQWAHVVCMMKKAFQQKVYIGVIESLTTLLFCFLLSSVLMAMWFGSHETSGGLGLNNSPHSPHMRTHEPYSLGQDHEGVQSVLNATSCYDLMRNSSKVCSVIVKYLRDIFWVDNVCLCFILWCFIVKMILFETTIPFQLAFYALLEHGKYATVAVSMTLFLISYLY